MRFIHQRHNSFPESDPDGTLYTQEPTEVCDNLSDYPEVEEEVQSFVNTFLLKQTLLKSFLTAVAALFMGAIADRLGVRYCTTISIFGRPSN